MLSTIFGEDGKVMHSYEEHWKNCIEKLQILWEIFVDLF